MRALAASASLRETLTPGVVRSPLSAAPGGECAAGAMRFFRTEFTPRAATSSNLTALYSHYTFDADAIRGRERINRSREASVKPEWDPAVRARALRLEAAAMERFGYDREG
jgi:hypothetical protein